MPVKKRYEIIKAWKEFDKLPKPEFLNDPFWQAQLEKQGQEMKRIKELNLKDQGRYWAASNKKKGCTAANLGYNAKLHEAAVARAIQLIEPYKNDLNEWGIKSKIARKSGLSESTIRKYVKIYQNNSHDL